MSDAPDIGAGSPGKNVSPAISGETDATAVAESDARLSILKARDDSEGWYAEAAGYTGRKHFAFAGVGRMLADTAKLAEDLLSEVLTLRGRATVQVHHFDIEAHAKSFNEGYTAAMAQSLADDPSAADEWLLKRDSETRAEALREAADILTSKIREQWDLHTQGSVGAQIVAQRMQVLETTIRGRADSAIVANRPEGAPLKSGTSRIVDEELPPRERPATEEI